MYKSVPLLVLEMDIYGVIGTGFKGYLRQGWLGKVEREHSSPLRCQGILVLHFNLIFGGC